MKVFEINTVCGTGSTGRIAADLAHMLEEKGDSCCIAFSRGNAPADVESFRFGNKLEIYWHGIMTRVTDRHGMYSAKATRDLIEKIRNYNPDIIHLHNIHGYYLNIELLFEFLRTYGKPVVWTLHDCWTYTGHCAYYSSAGCEKWISQCSECPLKGDYPGSMLKDNSSQNYRIKKKLFTSVPRLHLVVPSEWLKEEVQKSFFGQASALYPEGVPCTAIPNGIDTEQFKYTESNIKEILGIPDKKMILGVANVWKWQKGFGDFIRLSEILDDSYRIVMVGVDKKRKKELPERIIAIERTNRIEELAELYSAAEVYVNASIEETMGMTTGEAICCGTPVVAYRATAIPESVGEGCGCLVKPQDVSGIKQAIETIAADRTAYSKACLQYRSRFEKAKAYERYYEIYRSMPG